MKVLSAFLLLLLIVSVCGCRQDGAAVNTETTPSTSVVQTTAPTPTSSTAEPHNTTAETSVPAPEPKRYVGKLTNREVTVVLQEDRCLVKMRSEITPSPDYDCTRVETIVLNGEVVSCEGDLLTAEFLTTYTVMWELTGKDAEAYRDREAAAFRQSYDAGTMSEEEFASWQAILAGGSGDFPAAMYGIQKIVIRLEETAERFAILEEWVYSGQKCVYAYYENGNVKSESTYRADGSLSFVVEYDAEGNITAATEY